MNCIKAQDSLVEYLLDELNDQDRTFVEDHLMACPACRTELQRLSEAIAILCGALPGRPVSAALRQHILARSQHDTALDDSTSSSRKPHVCTSGEMLWAFAAGVLLMAVLQIVLASAAISKTNPAMTVAEKVGPESINSFGVNDPKDGLEILEQRSEKTQFVALHRPSKTNDLSGQLLWDELNREVHIYCFGLPQPPAGMQYTLWLIGTRERVRILDELKVDAKGECRAVARWPAGKFQFAQVTLSPGSAIDSTSRNTVALTSDMSLSNGF